MLTDGRTIPIKEEIRLLKDFAKKLKEHPNTTVIAVGVGKRIKSKEKEELNLIGQHVFIKLTFEKLIDHMEDIKRALCPSQKVGQISVQISPAVVAMVAFLLTNGFFDRKLIIRSVSP